MPSIAVAVVIPTKDRPELLQDTLTATKACLRHGDELVVVDSASRDPNVGEIARRSGATVVRLEQSGTCRARNAGFRASSTPVVAFIDDDCVPQPGWVEAIADAFDKHPDMAFLTGTVLSGPEKPGSKAKGLPLSTSTASDPRLFATEDDVAELGRSGNMAWRRRAYEQIGGFDEALGPGTLLRAAEDHDVVLRALELGLEGRFEPSATVVHDHARGSWGQFRAYYNYGVGAGGLFVKQARRSPDNEDGQRLLGNGTLRFLWSRGVRPIARSIGSGYERAAAAEAMRLMGMAHGIVVARHMAVVDGHLVAGSSRHG